jgi:spermidine synthase
VSEPSNPWVSGVATLFSDEFYGRITHYLAPGGYFVQWMQV